MFGSLQRSTFSVSDENLYVHRVTCDIKNPFQPTVAKRPVARNVPDKNRRVLGNVPQKKVLLYLDLRILQKDRNLLFVNETTPCFSIVFRTRADG